VGRKFITVSASHHVPIYDALAWWMRRAWNLDLRCGISQAIRSHPCRFPTDAQGSALVKAKVCSIGFARAVAVSIVPSWHQTLWLRRSPRVHGGPVSVGALRDPGPRDVASIGRSYLIFLFWSAIEDMSGASTAMATITNDVDDAPTTQSVFHGPQNPPLLDLTLADFLDYQCLHFGEDEAIVTPWDGTRWTYHDLQQHSIYLARYLLENGIQAGDRVGILAGNRVEYASVFFACMRIGAILVILNNTYTSAEAQYALKYTGKSRLSAETGQNMANMSRQNARYSSALH
jgi:hypothetical protein